MHSSNLTGFEGRVAVVSGAARGIGQEVARTLHRAGCSVAALDVAFGETVAGGEPETPWMQVKCNVADEESVDSAFSHVENELGPIGILVNNAGILRAGSIANTDLETWQAMFRVNVDGPFLCARRVLPGMVKQQYGRVVTVGSSAGKTGGYGSLTAYAATKAAAMSLARSIATEYGKCGITSNAVAPAAIDTAMIAGLPSPLERIPVGRLGRPQDVAAAIMFLCSAEAGYVTAEVMDVNGGFLVD